MGFNMERRIIGEAGPFERTESLDETTLRVNGEGSGRGDNVVPADRATAYVC